MKRTPKENLFCNQWGPVHNKYVRVICGGERCLGWNARGWNRGAVDNI